MLSKLKALLERRHKSLKGSNERFLRKSAQRAIHKAATLLCRLEDYSTDEEVVALQEIRDNHLYPAINLIGE